MALIRFMFFSSGFCSKPWWAEFWSRGKLVRSSDGRCGATFGSAKDPAARYESPWRGADGDLVPLARSPTARQAPKKLSALSVKVCLLLEASEAHSRLHLHSLADQSPGIRHAGIRQRVPEGRFTRSITKNSVDSPVRSSNLQRGNTPNCRHFKHRWSNARMFIEAFPDDPLDLWQRKVDAHCRPPCKAASPERRSS